MMGTAMYTLDVPIQKTSSAILAFEEDDVETIGGLVVKHLGHIAEVGNTITFNGLTFSVIEVDGAYHAEREQAESDEIRESTLNDMGYRVIRFTNEEVLYNIEETLETITKEIGSYE